jgi:hypothetical protein
MDQLSAAFLKTGPISSPETSVSNHFTPRNEPQDERIQTHLNKTILRMIEELKGKIKV